MKRKTILSVLAIAVIATSAFAYVQVQNLASTINGCVSVAPAVRANSAATGSNCTITGYRGAAVVVGTGIVDNVTTSVYAVLQDSVAGAAFASRDSVAVDSVDNKYYDLHYRSGASNAVALRAILRATGAADTVVAGVTVLRLCNTRPCT